MITDGTWGDHVILYGAANYFETCIHVVSSVPHHNDVIICPEYDDNSRLVLGHVHELHYVSLRPFLKRLKFLDRRLPSVIVRKILQIITVIIIIIFIIIITIY